MDRERKSYWQEVRGICIIAVVAIHILAECQLRCKNIRLEWVLFRQLLNFAVPTFIFMAGYFTNVSKVNDSIGRYYLKRVERLLIPYLLWGILCAYDCGFCARKIVGYTFCEGSIWWIILSFEFLCCDDCIMWCGCMCKYNIAQEN